MKTGILSSVLLVLVSLSAIAAHPAPATVQPVDQWTLKVTYTQPQQIMLQMDKKENPRRFWYTILTVKNGSTFEEVSFYPFCELVTDTFQIIPADKTVQKSVFEVIKLKHQGSFPFLESLDFADRRIFQGQDNTRDFAIIWPDFDPKAKEISLFIAGLSNETAVIEHPELKDDSGNPKKIFLRKSLQLRFLVAGDEAFRANAVMKEFERNWVMR